MKQDSDANLAYELSLGKKSSANDCGG